MLLSNAYSQPASMQSPMQRSWEQKNDLGKGSGCMHKSRMCTIMPKMTPEEKVKHDEAKKYVAALNVRAAISKQATLQQQQQQMTRLKRDQALILLSRIYVGSIHSEVKEEQVKAAFLAFGPIKNLDMGWDPVLKKHKNFAFIEFEMPEAALLAIDALNGAALGLRPIKVSRPNSMPDTAPMIEHLIREGHLQPWVYIAGVHPDLIDEDLRSVFEAFGNIRTCVLAPDTVRPGKHRGFGFVQYMTPKAAHDAILSMNNFELGGQKIRVGPTLTQPHTVLPEGYIRPDSPGNTAWSPSPPSASNSNSASSCKPQQQEQSQSQAQPQPQHQQQQPLTPVKPIDGSVLVMDNMVTIDAVDDSLEIDIRNECKEHGEVVKVQFSPAGNFARIFVEFAGKEDALAAKQVLNGRFFDGRLIVASVFNNDRYARRDFGLP